MNRRFFLLTAGAVTLASAAGAGLAAASGQPFAEVERAGDRLALRWGGLGRTAHVFVSSDPDAPAAMMRVLATRVEGGAHEAVFSATPRPYFLVLGEGGRALRAAERLLPLEGGRNFRDLGGYAAADGRRVRWGRLYRSGVMTGLTAGDLSYLSALGIESVCDLREARERQAEPSPFSGLGAPDISAFGYEMDLASLRPLLAAQTREEAVAAFADGYVHMLSLLSEHFTDMFRRMVEGETPLAINCSAGKDRTGVASALLLSVLGVSRESVIADYALSERFVPVDTYERVLRNPDPTAAQALSPQERAIFTRLPGPVFRVLMGSDADVMRTTLARIDAEFGGPVALVQRRYGLGEAEIAHLRRVFTE